MSGLRAVLRPVVVTALVVVAGAAGSPTSSRSVSVLVTGGGTVASAEGLIQCGPRCATAYKNGAVVVLTATPVGDASFERWTGACVGTAPRCAVVVDRAVTVGAVFLGEPVDIAVTTGGPGTVYSDPKRLACGLTSKRCTATFAGGRTVLLRAVPEEDSTFRAWGGSCADSRSTTCALSVSGPAEVTAAFEHTEQWAGPHRLSLVDARAHVLSTPRGLACPPLCAASFAAGTLVTLRGRHEYSWDGGCVGVGVACLVVADRPRRVSADAPSGSYGPSLPADAPATPFPTGRAEYGVNVTVSGKGLVVGGRAIRCGASTGSILDCGGVYREGAQVVLRALPGKRSRFVRWGGFCEGRKMRCTVRVTSTKIVMAAFRRHHE
jgi:hypothetical protein